MRKLGMIYKQFDVAVVPFSFTDNTAAKKRPALILSDANNFNVPNQKSIMAMITTATHHSWMLDVKIEDLASAGLKVPSIVRFKLFTLDNVLIIKKIGSLTEKDVLAARKSLRQLFSFRSNF
jgi:mRNA interferase MazF